MALDLSILNDAQKEAVLTTEGPLLVLAGAGSGKTRVLTYRIAHLLQDLNVQPWEVLAITFTNKAATEMQERLASLAGPVANGMWVSTFHKCCGRILRSNAELLGFTDAYTIYDPDDQKRLIKAIMQENHMDDKRFAPKSVLNVISSAKNDLIFPDEFAINAGSPLEKTTAQVYVEYQKRLKAANAVDFDDMLLHAYVLLRDFPAVREAYQHRFKYILVDEYQDTNRVQYEICKILADAHKNIMVVGDDDQSIYSWRGADIRNILDFEKDYKNAKVVKLEENYRSTANILDAANAVIAKNKKRKSKRLFTSGEAGEKIGVYYASDERDEGRWIASEIDKAVRKKEVASHNDVAVLYRVNAQSRVLEDMFLRSGVPYRIVGGTKFFERKEIRDVMAYLTLIVNNNDDMAFERIVNVPRRGIGNTTIEKIRQEAASLGTSELIAAESLIGAGDLRGKTKMAMTQFVMFIRDAAKFEGELKDVIDNIIAKTGIVDELEEQNTDEARSRIENIKELLSVAEEFAESHETEDAQFEAPNADSQNEQVELEKTEATLPDFIEWVRLRTDLDAMAANDDAVTCMTIHSAKGLEFDQVFVAGLEEGIFPNMRMGKTEDDLEEERRLAYVAYTRAKKKLVLCHAQSRRLYGLTDNNPASRFLVDVPDDLRENLGIGSNGFEGSGWEKRGSRHGISGSGTSGYNSGRVSNVSSTSTARGTFSPVKIGVNPEVKSTFGGAASASRDFCVNDEVEHKIFGNGRVVGVDGDKVTIKFARLGKTKTLLKDFAPIVKV